MLIKSIEHFVIKDSLLKLFTLYSVIFLGSLGYFIVMPVYAELILSPIQGLLPEHVDITTRRIIFSLVSAFAPLLTLCIAPFIGHLSDQLGRKKVLLFCLGLTLISFLLPITAIAISSMTLLFISNAINSIASASQPIAQAALTDISTGRMKAYLMGLSASSMTAAMSFGPALGSYLIKDSFDATFWYSALFTVINIILVYLTFSSEKKRIKAAKTPSLLSSFKAYSPLAVTMLILVFLCQLAWSSYYQNINYTVISIWHLSISSNLYQQLMLIIGLSMILSLLVLYPVIIRAITVMQCLKLCLIIATLSMLAISLTYEIWLYKIILIPLSSSIAMTYPCYMSILSNALTKRHQGSGIALAGGLMGISWTLSGSFSGLIANINLHLANWLAVIILILALFLLFITIKKTAKKSKCLYI
ncbi:Metal-tetracycline/H(+) antiporter [Piscirickettsia salmonis]|uniref:MFS transporter n=1 Tax=Piscirickettsia salmonis TaxID=1238 RepID=UPI0012B6CBD7|nr:MFS transporter [Piscirickettsia salmonis]QGP50191.1 Metal-tetracycline/H(+) antiporter [Piscirickettsia salmonis]